MDCIKNQINSIHTQSTTFNIFPATKAIGNICCTAMDTGRPLVHNDQHAQEACCKECSWVCFPFTIIFDIISCPCRGIKHLLC